MSDISKDMRSDDDTVGHDAGVVRGSLKEMHQEQDLPVREQERPAGCQVLACAWGCWCW